MTVSPDELDDLAERLTQRLGIPFTPTTHGRVVFRDRLRTSDWAVPLLFDGHASRASDGAILPVDFVGHALWPHLRSATNARSGKTWWTCSLPATAAQAILQELTDSETDDDAAWSVEMLLDASAPPLHAHRLPHDAAA